MSCEVSAARGRADDFAKCLLCVGLSECSAQGLSRRARTVRLDKLPVPSDNKRKPQENRAGMKSTCLRDRNVQDAPVVPALFSYTETAAVMSGGMKMRQCMDSENLHRRLKKIIGQVQAIDRMVDEDVPCEDILAQINAAKSALHKCGQIVLDGHIKHCVREGSEHGDADQTVANFTKAVERFANMT